MALARAGQAEESKERWETWESGMAAQGTKQRHSIQNPDGRMGHLPRVAFEMKFSAPFFGLIHHLGRKGSHLMKKKSSEGSKFVRQDKGGKWIGNCRSELDGSRCAEPIHTRRLHASASVVVAASHRALKRRPNSH
jgi:hypothetical protein